jgi:multiple RNA-binding domain-containing protein 1
MSRLIIKNLPKHLKEVDLQRHFESNKDLSCSVTDAKIMLKNNRSRLFGFVGFKTEDQALKALKFFNNTYLHTSKINVELAKAQNDDTLARPWSKHSQGSSAFERRNPTTEKEGKKKREQKTEAKSEEVEEKKRKFREFLKINTTKNNEKQTWND